MSAPRVSFLQSLRRQTHEGPHRLPGPGTLKRAGTATLKRVWSAGSEALKRAASFSRNERRQKALIIACAYGVPPDSANQETGPSLVPDTPDLDAHPVQRSRQDGEPPRPLLHAHKDGHKLKQLLERQFNIRPEDIELLMDEGTYTEATWPTGDNIRAAMHRLLQDAAPGDNFVFAFIGHGGQQKNTDNTEIDGLDEYIIAVDNKEILDDDLNRALVDRLPPGCKLTTIFDCCHSGTALDLEYAHNVAEGETLMVRVVRPRSLYRKITQKGAIRSALKRVIGRQSGSVPERTIISFSACRDEENAWEFENGLTLTDLLVKIINRRGHMTCAQLHRALSAKFAEIGRTMRLRHHRTCSLIYKDQHPVYMTQKPVHKNELFILDPPRSRKGPPAPLSRIFNYRFGMRH